MGIIGRAMLNGCPVRKIYMLLYLTTNCSYMNIEQYCILTFEF